MSFHIERKEKSESLYRELDFIIEVVEDSEFQLFEADFVSFEIINYDEVKIFSKHIFMTNASKI